MKQNKLLYYILAAGFLFAGVMWAVGCQKESLTTPTAIAVSDLETRERCTDYTLREMQCYIEDLNARMAAVESKLNNINEMLTIHGLNTLSEPKLTLVNDKTGALWDLVSHTNTLFLQPVKGSGSTMDPVFSITEKNLARSGDLGNIMSFDVKNGRIIWQTPFAKYYLDFPVSPEN